MTETGSARLEMSLGEAIYTQRSIRRLRPDPIPIEDIHTIIEAASKAPNGGNAQPARYLVLTDPDVIRQFGALYREAWWAKRRDEGQPWTQRDEIPAEDRVHRGAAQLADEIADAPCIVLALTLGKGTSQFGLAGRPEPDAGGTGAGHRLGADDAPPAGDGASLRAARNPGEAEFHLCIPLGYPRGRFGPTNRRPTAETTYLNGWGEPVPWAGDPPTN